MNQPLFSERREQALGLVLGAVSEVLRARTTSAGTLTPTSVLIGAPEAILDSLGIVMALSVIERELAARPALLPGVSPDRLYDSLADVVTIASLVESLLVLDGDPVSKH